MGVAAGIGLQKGSVTLEQCQQTASAARELLS